MFEKYLQNLGFTDKESLVYIALLQVDNSSIIEISKKTKINRTTVYLVVDSLMKKGLVGEVHVDKKTYYQAEPPERIETFVNQQKLFLEEQSKKLKDFIPQLKSIQRESGEKPVVKYFEGKEGIISASEELFRDIKRNKGEKTSYLIYSKDLIEEVFSEEERKKYREMRIKNNVKSKSVYVYTKGDYPSDGMGERVSIDPKKYPIYCDISARGSSVRISILGKKVSGIFIRSKDLAETIKSLVNYIHDAEKS